MAVSRCKDFTVTVGVCVRDCEGLINETIESIINQDFPHKLMEVIFVDDGSQDKTLSIIESHVRKMDISTRVFHHDWKGLGAGRNVVVNHAEGKYVIWVDGDMQLTRDFVRKQVEFMERNPNVGIGKGKYAMYTQANLLEDLENMEFLTTIQRHKGQKNSLALGTGGAIYRAEAIRQVGGFNPNIKGSGEDIDAECKIKAAGWLLEVTSAVFYERRRKTWKSLWDEYFWHGRSGPYFFRRGIIVNPYKLLPPVAFIVELFRTCAAYKLTHRKVALLLSFHYAFKRTAWLTGFMRSFFESGNYKPTSS